MNRFFIMRSLILVGVSTFSFVGCGSDGNAVLTPQPFQVPTASPSGLPKVNPSPSPTMSASVGPSASPSAFPSHSPSPIVSPSVGPTVAPTAVPTVAPTPVTTPTSLTFTSVGSSFTQSFVVSEINYAGVFTETDTCVNIATIATDDKKTFRVTPTGAGQCSITASDSFGRLSAPVTISVTTTNLTVN